MTTMIGQEKPSLEETLEHHGVKGMKWGVRKEGTDGGGSNGTRRAATSEEINNARVITAARYSKIAEASMNGRLATTEHGKREALKVMEKYSKQIASTDDARIASMSTKGEKIANVMLAGALGAAVNRSNTRKTTVENFSAHGPKLQEQKHFSDVTNQVIRDHNRLGDPMFRSIYGISKKGYAKRIAKGDPNPQGKL